MNATLAITLKNRSILENFLNSFSIDQLNKTPKGFKNNIFCNIAHVVASQQLLVYKLSNLPMQLPEDWINEFKKETKPERIYTIDDVNCLKNILLTTIFQTENDLIAGKFQSYNPYQTSNGFLLNYVEDGIIFNNFYEVMHLGIILQIKKFV
jgi:hypothetical protein